MCLRHAAWRARQARASGEMLDCSFIATVTSEHGQPLLNSTSVLVFISSNQLSPERCSTRVCLRGDCGGAPTNAPPTDSERGCYEETYLGCCRERTGQPC